MESKIEILLLTICCFTVVGMDTTPPEPERNEFLQPQLLHCFFEDTDDHPFPLLILSQGQKYADIQKHIISHCADVKDLPLYMKDSLDCKDPSIRCVIYSPDGKRLATGGNEGTICIFNNMSGEQIRPISFLRYGAKINAMKYSPDGKQLAVAGNDVNVCIFDTALGGCTHLFSHGDTSAYSLAYSSDGKQVATGGRDGKARMFDIATKECIATFDHGALITMITYASDDKYLITGSRSGNVCRFDIKTGDLFVIFEHDRLFRSIIYTPDGKRMVKGVTERNTKAPVFEITTGEFLLHMTNYNDSFFLITFSPDDKRLVMCSHLGDVYIFDAKKDKCLHMFNYGDYLFTSLAYSPHGTQFAIGCNDSKTRIFENYVPTTWEQFFLLRLISLWLCVEKPNKKVNTCSRLLKNIAQKFSTQECMLSSKYLETIWSSFPTDVCSKVWDKIAHAIQEYGIWKSGVKI